MNPGGIRFKRPSRRRGRFRAGGTQIDRGLHFAVLVTPQTRFAVFTCP
jgi:hypothetical protein